MPRNAVPRTTLRRARAFVVAAAMVVAALILGTVSVYGGTYALWNDGVAFPNQTIRSGSPALDLAGFQQLDGFTFSADALVATADVTVTNTGNVPLHDITLSFTSNDEAWDQIVGVMGISPAVPDPNPLAPGSPRVYTVTIAVPNQGALDDVAGSSTTVTVEAMGTAGTSWVASAEGSFSIWADETDPGGGGAGGDIWFGPPENATGPWDGSSLRINWITPDGVDSSTFLNLYANGVRVAESIQAVHNETYYFDAYRLSADDLPTAVGQHVDILFEVRADGSSEALASGTAALWWLDTGGYAHFVWALIDWAPAAASTEPAHGPGAPAPAPAPELGPDPESLPEATPDPSVTTEVPLEVSDAGDGSLGLTWQNPDGIPDGIGFALHVDDLDGTFTLSITDPGA